ncbi:hypothetical protein Sj15T_10020 [Sphingobium sp. TA15]|uniref:Uncharacterized protein n=1 Tax=Sphingobium indicum (strain DSM 16413 / CCM 7287 / MTCC 6362 / UT26 / NBRC 101211 / UT26S) TaxID=452662 RepID=D4Z8S3_SPHIU|nr:hypothetical protein [Sphingobium indicum]BAI99005.1 hypothetical protein SJA_P1-00530 [Sphingobium indicum UT26S]BDD65981.1 hypothetical protein Sj15T_10020 [Sphingobium sp. TA15]
MTKTAQSIYDEAVLGATICYSDGTPRPPDRFKRKLRAWEARNGRGRLTRRSPGSRGSRPYPATFTLHEGNYGSEGVIILSVNRIFSVADERAFEIVDVPSPGAALVLHRWSDEPELLHVAADRAAAESWRDRHGYPNAYIEIVGEAESVTKVA